MCTLNGSELSQIYVSFSDKIVYAFVKLSHQIRMEMMALNKMDKPLFVLWYWWVHTVKEECCYSAIATTKTTRKKKKLQQQLYINRLERNLMRKENKNYTNNTSKAKKRTNINKDEDSKKNSKEELE